MYSLKDEWGRGCVFERKLPVIRIALLHEYSIYLHIIVFAFLCFRNGSILKVQITHFYVDFPDFLIDRQILQGNLQVKILYNLQSNGTWNKEEETF